MDLNNPVEFLRSRWLGGRGTKFLYLAILTTIAGVLLMGQDMSEVQADVVKAETTQTEVVELAAEVAEVCGSDGFRRVHGELCSRAEKVLGEKSSSSPPVHLVDAAGSAK